MRSMLLPTKTLAPPCSCKVTGRSVFQRSVRQGVPNTQHSSCKPPLSVSIMRVWFHRHCAARPRCGRLLCAIFWRLRNRPPLNMLRISRGRQRGIYITNYHYPIRLLFHTYFFKGYHCIAHLLGMSAGTDTQINVSFRNSQ
jgi:hypothetical protein